MTVAPDRPPIVPSRMIVQVIDGADRGKVFELEQGTYLVGKDPACAFVLSDAGVSRQHLELRVTDAGIVVRDLNSRNGSYFEGARFTDVSVGAGAQITIGKTTLKFTVPASQHAMLPSEADRFGSLLGRSVKMRQVFALLERVAPSDVSVLVTGETGTGKELCAEAIHSHGTRAKGPFVVCDLAGVSRSLIESELFGHARGAFTGADRDREGAFTQAHRGTLFIDEVGELEIEMQPRLLRALEQKAVKPVGKSNYIATDTRVVAATNRDLRAEVKAGRFREDLFHRLAVVEVRLPPLRERKEDIGFIVDHLLAGRDISLPADTHALLNDYDWPGNVRELRNVIERATSMMGDERVLSPRYLGLDNTPKSRTESATPFSGEESTGSFKEAKDQLIANWERAYVTQLLKRTNGNVSKAARIGGLDRVSLHRLIKRHNLQYTDEDS